MTYRRVTGVCMHCGHDHGTKNSLDAAGDANHRLRDVGPPAGVAERRAPPSAMVPTVEYLRETTHQQHDQIVDLHRFLRQIRAWDMMDSAADGKFWREQIDKLLPAQPTERKPTLHSTSGGQTTASGTTPRTRSRRREYLWTWRETPSMPAERSGRKSLPSSASRSDTEAVIFTFKCTTCRKRNETDNPPEDCVLHCTRCGIKTVQTFEGFAHGR